ncbi:MAG: D-alanyl-D-alanine carboxypeptidase [Armatimonadetes bacterium]|nr:MAG: D-alanyl-D-alanine carboxypeptidase [Armatimonadota bacterium]
MDASTGQVLFAKNEHVRMFPASTTKILTALLLAEGTKPYDEIRAPLDVETIEGSSLYLAPAERIRAEDLVYALLMRSANDGAHAAAVHLAGSDAEFAEKMNERAAQIGCKDSHFANPHGLHDPNHYTSAYDMALIAREAMKNDLIRAAAKCQRRTIWRSTNLEDTLLSNKNRLLREDADAIGLKTGYTSAAGHCFVGVTNRDGWELITVVFKSEDWVKDTQALYQYAYREFERQTIVRKGDLIGTAEILDGERGTVPVVAGADVVGAMRPGRGPTAVELECGAVSAPIREGQEIGRLRVTLPDGFVVEAPALASEGVAVRPKHEPAQWAAFSFGGLLMGVGVVILLRARYG